MPRDPLARYELVHGQLVRMPSIGGEHGAITVRFASKLLAYVEPRRMGEVMVEVGYRLTRDPDTVRAPDVSFLAADQALCDVQSGSPAESPGSSS